MIKPVKTVAGGHESASGSLAKTFHDMARDPRIIPGVHHYCDEWCDMCPVTSRCLAFRCNLAYRKERGRRDDEPTFRSVADAVTFTRLVAAAEGMTTPEVDAIAAGQEIGLRTADSLTDIAWQYAVGVSMWLVLTPEELRRMRSGPAPSPAEVLLWHHLRIYIKLVRALVARERPSGGAEADSHMNGPAKVTLVSIQRSRKALQQLKRTPAADTASTLLVLLETLERGIDDRFPRARAFIRVGLDVQAG